MWTIDSADSTIDRKLKRFRSDKAVIKGYKTAVEELASSEDPTTSGERKRGRLRYCYSYNVTKSHRLLYRVIYESHTIQLIDLDDHKNLFGRDNRP